MSSGKRDDVRDSSRSRVEEELEIQVLFDALTMEGTGCRIEELGDTWQIDEGVDVAEDEVLQVGEEGREAKGTGLSEGKGSGDERLSSARRREPKGTGLTTISPSW